MPTFREVYDNIVELLRQLSPEEAEQAAQNALDWASCRRTEEVEGGA